MATLEGMKGSPVSARLLLLDWMQRAHLNQRQAALRLGVHYTFVNQILSGRKSVGLLVAVRFEEVTGIPAKAWVATRVAKRARRVPSGAGNALVDNG